MTLHWQSPERYATALLTPDLFGGWVLVTATGSRFGSGGRVQRKPLQSYDEGVLALRDLRHRRRKQGYALCRTAFTQFDGLHPRGADMRGAETQALFKVFSVWDISLAHQAGLLGLDVVAWERYQDGRPLADDSVLLARAAHLLAIHKVLRLRYANRKSIIREWLHSPCDFLDGASPLAVMLGSASGLRAMRRTLEQKADNFRTCPSA